MEVKRTAKGHQGVEGKGTALHHLAGGATQTCWSLSQKRLYRGFLIIPFVSSIVNEIKSMAQFIRFFWSSAAVFVGNWFGLTIDTHI